MQNQKALSVLFSSLSSTSSRPTHLSFLALLGINFRLKLKQDSAVAPVIVCRCRSLIDCTIRSIVCWISAVYQYNCYLFNNKSVILHLFLLLTPNIRLYLVASLVRSWFRGVRRADGVISLCKLFNQNHFKLLKRQNCDSYKNWANIREKERNKYSLIIFWLS